MPFHFIIIHFTQWCTENIVVFLNNSIPSSNHSCKGGCMRIFGDRVGELWPCQEAERAGKKTPGEGEKKKHRGGRGGSWRRNKDRRDN